MKNESGYGRIEVKEVIEKNELLRLLLVDEIRESAAYMEDGRHYELYFKYTRDLVAPVSRHPEIRDTLLLGGAGFSIPKYYISAFTDKNIDVVEFNPLMYQLALKYFYLDDLYRDYHLTENRRMEVFIEDANEYLRRTEKCYDLIINDAYIANRMDDDLLKDRQVKLIKKRLNPGGIYIMNIITALQGANSMPGILEYEIMRNNFKNVEMYPCKTEPTAFERQNVVITGSDKELLWI